MSLGPAARLGWGWPGVGDPSVPEPEDLLRGMEVEISPRRPAHCRSNEKRGERGLSNYREGTARGANALGPVPDLGGARLGGHTLGSPSGSVPQGPDAAPAAPSLKTRVPDQKDRPVPGILPSPTCAALLRETGNPNPSTTEEADRPQSPTSSPGT